MTQLVSPELELPKGRVLIGSKGEILGTLPDVKVTAVIQTFNAAKGLEETLKSLRDRVDRVLVIDGYFTMNDNPHYHPPRTKTGGSTDDSEAVAKKYGAIWIPADREYKTQKDKLNRIPELVNDGDWIFLIDTDEVLVSYIRDGLRSMASWFSQWDCDMVMMKLDEPFYAHPQTGQYGRHRFYARLLKARKNMRWENEATIIWPGAKVQTYAGTFPMTVYLRHLRQQH